MEIPKVIGLWSDEGDHAGFMLLAPNADGLSGDCVFMLTPVSLAGVSSRMGIVISELKVAGEHKFVAHLEEGGISLSVHPETLPKVELQFNLVFKGNVFTEMNGERICIGSAEPMQK